MILYAALLVLYTLTGVLCNIVDNCPKPDDINPCMCKPNYDGACIITCTLVKEEDLLKLAKYPNLCKGHFHFVLYQSRITGIPTELWKKMLSSETVDVSIEHSTMEHLIPPNDSPLPKIYSPGEAAIRLDYVKNIDGWQWGQLQKFIPGGDLTVIIDNTELTQLNEDFSKIADGNVHKVTIDRTQLTKLPDHIFSGYRFLSSLSVQNNALQEIKRSMFPRPAAHLQFLHINGNSLTSIPGDLFDDMPKLAVVYARDNKLTTVPSNLFKTVNSNSIQRFDFVNNPWNCDCELMWIVSGANYHMDFGVCSSPADLQNKKVKELPTLIDCEQL